MAVTWSWKAKMGEANWTTVSGKTKKVTIYRGNCLMVMTENFVDKETKEEMYNFVTFINDMSHLKRCLGLKKLYDGSMSNCFDGVIKKIKLNTYYTDATKIAEQFAKAGIRAELYYKEPKKSKKSALTL